ncbi:MAG TPA: amidase [Acetobacteraceae bacterium]|nr:amidase [Acetobacteraceae bacterium]
MSDELCFLPIAEAARQIAARALSPVALTEAYLARILAVDAQLNAYVTMTADLALQQAKAAEAELQRGLNRGPLHGIPFGLKDMVETAGILTTAHSRLLAHNYPAKDAAVVERLRDAGAVLLGKHASHEFAHGGPSFDLPWPPARNPWNAAHYTNGSSSGSAAAVAGGLAAMAIGTDTGGSIRSPSFLCGTVGLKPTFGLVSRSGVIPFSMSCDHVGPITRSVEDCAIVLQAIAGHDPRDPGSARRELPDFAASLRAGIKGLRIGIVRHFWEEDAPANATLRMAVDAAIDVLRDLGAIVEDVRLRSLRHYYAVRIVLTESELFARHQHSLQQNPGAYGEHFLSRILAATLFTSADYIAAQRERRSIMEDMQPVYARYDALLTAGAGPAPRLDAHQSLGARDKWASPGVGALFSVTGAPALALPCGFSDDGLPLGMQIAGRPFEDATLLRIGHAYEQATRWGDRKPALIAGAVQPAIHTDAEHASPVDVTDDIRGIVDAMLRRAGLRLTESQRDLLYQAAPYAMAMTQLLPRDRSWNDDQASVFRLEQ